MRTPTPQPRPPPRLLEVKRVSPITPRMVRVTFVGPTLAEVPTPGAATHIKLFLPEEGQTVPLLPQLGPEGLTWPEGPRPTVRTYTPRAFRKNGDAPELDVDFFLHDEGPAARWAANAQPGDAAGMAGPSPSAYAIDPEARAFVLAGDESAIPALQTILERLPKGVRAEVLVEVADRSDEVAMDSEADTRVTWLHRGHAPGKEGALLAEALRTLELSPEARYWVACEAAQVRAIRRTLLGEQGVSPQALVTRGYWKQATPNHPDHDYGTDA